MYTWLIIGIGGFIGAVLRYGVGGWIQGTTTTFPVGTLGVNTLGSFFLALIMYLSEYSGFFSDQTRIFLTIGVIGAFTTMSTFSYESFRMDAYDTKNKQTDTSSPHLYRRIRSI